MLNLFRDLRGFAIRAYDDKKGSVDDIYFDEDYWSIRYVVADIGPIFFGRKGLIGSALLDQPDVRQREWPVKLSKAEVEDAPKPGAGTVEPISAQEERHMRDQTASWPPFLLGAEGLGYSPILAEQQLSAMRPTQREQDAPAESWSHLRSMSEVLGYKVRAQDDWIGTIDDYVIDPQPWQVRYAVVDTGDWLPGKRVVLSVDLLSDINWSRGEVTVRMNRRQIEASPPIDSISGIERSDADALIAHYGGTPI